MNQRNGFSLVELMVTLVISTMLIVTLMGLTTQLVNTARAAKKNHPSEKWATILKSQIEDDYRHAVSVVIDPRTIAIQANKIPCPQLQKTELTTMQVPVLVAYEVVEKDEVRYLFRTETRLDLDAPENRFRQLLCEGVTSFSTTTRLDTDVAPGAVNVIVYADQNESGVLFETTLVRHGVAQ